MFWKSKINKNLKKGRNWLFPYFFSRLTKHSKIRYFFYLLRPSLLVVGIILLAAFPSIAWSANYFISPDGSDTNSGATPVTPWKTFNFAIPKLQPGDSLILINGIYEALNTGLPDIDCSREGHNNGTSSNPIKIKAENERQAFLKVDGSSPAFRVMNCSHWIIEGLRAKSEDRADSPNSVDVFFVRYSNNLTFRRLLVSHNNRYKNSQLLLIWNSNNILVEESEFYWFHRHSVLFAYTNNSIARRNYSNSRAHGDLPGGWGSTGETRGQSGLAIYPGSNNIGENNISEGQRSGISISASHETVGNKFYGNISLKDTYGYLPVARGTGINAMPRDTVIENSVVIKPEFAGVLGRGNKNTRIRNMSVFGGPNGLVADFVSATPGDGIYSFFSENVLVMDNSNTGIITQGQTMWSHNYSNGYNNGTNFYPSTNVMHATTIDPGFGNCLMFVPMNSPLKGKGAGGEDIGANILYRYQNGKLTNQPLWNPQTGQFPTGAIIEGVNDISDSSLFDVHKRLNVNTNGCTFPEHYKKEGGLDLTPHNLTILRSR